MKLTVVDRVEHAGVSLTGAPLPAPVAELVMFRCLMPPKDRHVTAGVEPSVMAKAFDAETRTLDRSLCPFLVGGWPEEWGTAETLTD
jgi:hypothetical protein